MKGDRPEVTVVGSGIAGVMTALSLLRKGCRVTLVDRWESGHARAAESILAHSPGPSRQGARADTICVAVSRRPARWFTPEADPP